MLSFANPYFIFNGRDISLKMFILSKLVEYYRYKYLSRHKCFKCTFRYTCLTALWVIFASTSMSTGHNEGIIKLYVR